MDEDEKIAELKSEVQDLDREINAIQSAADDDNNRQLTDEEKEKIDAMQAKCDEIFEDIERRERMVAQRERLSQSLGRRSQPSNPSPNDQNQDDPEPNINANAQLPNAQRRQQQALPARPRAADSGRWGFRSLGDFARDVVMSSGRGRAPTSRLQQVMNAPTTYGVEGTGADGGFLVPPDFRTEIMQQVMGTESLISRCNVMYTAMNSMKFPVDAGTPWGSSGPQAYWTAEAGQITQSKPSVKTFTVEMEKVAALVPITEELQSDAVALSGYLTQRVGAAFDYTIQNALINGSGAGQPQGILNADCLVSQAKDTAQEGSPAGQPAGTVTYRNIVDIYNRIYSPLRNNAVWFINQDVEPQLDLMKFLPNVNASGTPVPVYLPPGGASATPYATLKGRPVIPIESCAALGTVGDIILADMSKYIVLLKTGGGMRQDVNMGLFFDYDMLAFRFIFRIGGRPWWPAAITPPNSSTTRSCFITLATRS